ALPPSSLFITARPLSPISTLSLHDALPIFRAITLTASWRCSRPKGTRSSAQAVDLSLAKKYLPTRVASACPVRWCSPPRKRADKSEEHTSELQSRENLVCRLLLEKKQIHHD